jgi:hypothetical protein
VIFIIDSGILVNLVVFVCFVLCSFRVIHDFHDNIGGTWYVLILGHFIGIVKFFFECLIILENIRLKILNYHYENHRIRISSRLSSSYHVGSIRCSHRLGITIWSEIWLNYISSSIGNLC